MNPQLVRALTVAGVIAVAAAVGHTARTAGAATPTPPAPAECVLRPPQSPPPPPQTMPSRPVDPAVRVPGRLTAV